MTPNLGQSPLLRPLRDRVGRWLHTRIDAVASEQVRRELAARRETHLCAPRHRGPGERLNIASTAVLNDALLDTESGGITVEEYAFLATRLLCSRLRTI